MKIGSTLLLQIALAIIAAATLAVCVLALPSAITSQSAGYYLPVLFGLYVPAAPFFIALYQAYKILRYIDNTTAFSVATVRALRVIKFCATIIAALFTGGMPYIYIAAQQDDAPGVIVIGMVIIFASAVIAVFAALLERLLHQAIAIKSENDLTV